MFDNLDKPGSKTGTGPDAKAVANPMSEAFPAFARAGDPKSPAVPASGKDAPP